MRFGCGRLLQCCNRPNNKKVQHEASLEASRGRPDAAQDVRDGDSWRPIFNATDGQSADVRRRSAWCPAFGVDQHQYLYLGGYWRGTEDPYPHTLQCNEDDWYATRAYDATKWDGGCIQVQTAFPGEMWQTISTSCDGGPYWYWKWNGGSTDQWLVRVCIDSTWNCAYPQGKTITPA